MVRILNEGNPGNCTLYHVHEGDTVAGFLPREVPLLLHLLINEEIRKPVLSHPDSPEHCCLILIDLKVLEIQMGLKGFDVHSLVNHESCKTQCLTGGCSKAEAAAVGIHSRIDACGCMGIDFQFGLKGVVEIRNKLRTGTSSVLYPGDVTIGIVVDVMIYLNDLPSLKHPGLRHTVGRGCVKDEDEGLLYVLIGNIPVLRSQEGHVVGIITVTEPYVLIGERELKYSLKALCRPDRIPVGTEVTCDQDRVTGLYFIKYEFLYFFVHLISRASASSSESISYTSFSE